MSTPAGFDGSVAEGAWALLATGLGVEYSFEQVDSANRLDPSISTTVARTVNVTGGIVINHGVRFKFLGGAIQLDVVASGTRWDTISLQFDWSNNTCTLVKTNGGTTPLVFAARTPGTLDDYVICLARVVAGQTDVQELVERRVASMPPVVSLAPTTPAPAAYRYGQLLLRLDNHEVMVRRGVPGAENWDSLTHPPAVALTMPATIASADAPTIRRVGGQTFIEGTVSRASGVFAGFQPGVYTRVAQLPASPAYFRPPKSRGWACSTAANGTDVTAKVVINPTDGWVSVMPSVEVFGVDLNGISWFN